MMKKLIVSMLFLSITGNLFAQVFGKQVPNPFTMVEDYTYNRTFYVALDKNEWVKIDLSDITDIDRLTNADSILKLFLRDIQLLNDSLENPVTGKKIDYYIDSTGRNQIRIHQQNPLGNSFIVAKEDIALLKLQQDTVIIAGVIQNPPKAVEKMNSSNTRIYRFTFYLNDYKNLEKYTNGVMASKLATVRIKNPGLWNHNNYGYFIKNDPSISAPQRFGFTHGTGDYLSPFLTVNLQNYKNHFVPSFNMGATIVLANRPITWYHAISASWEPQFLFRNNSAGKLETFRNDFISIMYGQGPVSKKNTHEEGVMSNFVSLAYLVRNKGDFYDKNTWRLGFGIQVKRTRTNIEPLIYFHDLFKGVTPGARVLFSF